MIETLMLVDDENLFHIIFEDICSLLDISLSVKTVSSSDDAEKMFKKWFSEKSDKNKPECVFVDLNLIGSSYDGIELIRRINFEYGNKIVIGIISASEDDGQIAKAVKSGAQFWVVKTDNLETKLKEFKKDYNGFKNRTQPFKVYK